MTDQSTNVADWLTKLAALHQLADATEVLASNRELTADGLMSEANVSRSVAARAIREATATKAVA